MTYRIRSGRHMEFTGMAATGLADPHTGASGVT